LGGIILPLGYTLKNIKTLVKDVYDVTTRDQWFDELQSEEYCRQLGQAVHTSLTRQDEIPSLRLSAMGEKCPRSLWASIHAPSVQTKFRPQTKIIFHYGNVIEQLALALAKAAGHTVTGEQDELVLDGIVGHRDCIIDGCIVDVKSTTSRGMETFKQGRVEEDIFLRSYLDQLDGYAVASLDDPLVTNHEFAYIWAIDKQLGHMYLHEHRIRPDHIRQRIEQYKSIVNKTEPPTCNCGTLVDSKSGNIRLDTKASYNPFKYFCHPKLRTFIVKGKPVDLVKVVVRPDGVEMSKDGLIIL
jgi:hypothetical protein